MMAEKQSAEKLHGMETRNYENCSAPYFFCDCNLQIVWQNKAAEDFFPGLHFSTLPDLLSHMGIEPLEVFLPDIKSELLFEASLLLEFDSDSPIRCSKLLIYNAPPFCKNQLFVCCLKDNSPGPLKETLAELVAYETQYQTPISSIFASLNHYNRCLKTGELGNGRLKDCVAVSIQRLMELWRLTEMIDEYEKLKKGNVLHKVECVDFLKLLNSTLDWAHELLQEVHVELYRQIPVEPLVITTEPEYVLRIIGHLISNAARYSGRGMISAVCKIHSDSLDFIVENSGDIPASIRTRIFEPFFPAKLNEDIRVPAHGLGLTVANEYAKFIGVQLSLDSWEERVSFRLTLPLCHAPAPAYIPDARLKTRFRIILADVLNTF